MRSCSTAVCWWRSTSAAIWLNARGQLADLVVRLHRHARVVVALRDAADRLAERCSDCA